MTDSEKMTWAKDIRSITTRRFKRMRGKRELSIEKGTLMDSFYSLFAVTSPTFLGTITSPLTFLAFKGPSLSIQHHWFARSLPRTLTTPSKSEWRQLLQLNPTRSSIVGNKSSVSCETVRAWIKAIIRRLRTTTSLDRSFDPPWRETRGISELIVAKINKSVVWDARSYRAYSKYVSHYPQQRWLREFNEWH